jgi:hypothetical protein
MLSIERAKEILDETKWAHPSDYGGYSPNGEYVITSQSRDSDSLSRSNYERIFEDLKELNPKDWTGGNAPVYDFRAGHWACGWVEYLMVKDNAPDNILIISAEILCALSDYPVYDETHWSELEYNEAGDYWASLNVRDRAELIKETGCGASIFAARYDYLPQDDNGSLMESLNGN